MRIVHRPDFVRMDQKREWHPRFGAKSLTPPTLHRQPFLPFPSLLPPAPTVHPDQPTGASLTEPCFFWHNARRFSFRPRAYHFLPAPPSARRGPAPAAPRSSSAVRFVPPADAAAGSRSLPDPPTLPSSGRTWL